MAQLLDFSGRGIAGLGDYRVLDRLAFLVGDAQRLIRGRVYQLHLDLAILAILGRIRRAVAERVLIAQSFVDSAVDGWKLAVEAWKEGLSPGFFGEGAHLVVSLQKIQPLDGPHPA